MKKWIEKQVKTGQKYERLYPVVEAIFSTLFSNEATTKKPPHVRDFITVKRHRIVVFYALLPCLLAGIYNVGYQALKNQKLTIHFIDAMRIGFSAVMPMLLAVYGVGLLIEITIALKKQKEIQEGLLVTGALYILILPASVPLWLVVGAFVFGLFLRQWKHFFHPTLIAALIVYAVRPSAMLVAPIWTSGHVTLWLFIALAILIGSKMISKKIMLSAYLSAIVTIIFLKLFAPHAMPTAWILLLGQFFFATIFIATDRESGPHINDAHVIYGVGMGVLAMLLRYFLEKPASIMMAIAIIQLITPFIDQWALRKRLQKRIPNRIDLCYASDDHATKTL